jgi:hypothetical protein
MTYKETTQGAPHMCYELGPPHPAGGRVMCCLPVGHGGHHHCSPIECMPRFGAQATLVWPQVAP